VKGADKLEELIEGKYGTLKLSVHYFHPGKSLRKGGRGY
jgi:hypothetical protein